MKVSHINVRHDSIASFAISEKGGGSPFGSVLIEGVQDWLLQTSPFAYSNICFVPSALASQKSRNL
jgi:hypothetical protein